MGSIDVFTADRSRYAEDNTIVGANVVDGELIFDRYDGSQLNAGPVIANAVLNVNGEWDTGQTYEVNSIVTHDGSSWIASAPISTGQEPGVHASWQEFIVNDATPDLTQGDHVITGQIYYSPYGPIVPAAISANHAANLGDITDTIANQPLLLDTELGEITYEEDLGDIRTVITPHLLRNSAYTASGLFTETKNTTVETNVSLSLILQPEMSNLTRLVFRFGGDLLNNTGSDVIFTFKIKALGSGAGNDTVVEFACTVPANSPADIIRRPFLVESFMEMGNGVGGNNVAVHGVSRCIIGARADAIGAHLIDSLKSNSGASTATNLTTANIFLATMKMNVASNSASIWPRFASAERHAYVAFA